MLPKQLHLSPVNGVSSLIPLSRYSQRKLNIHRSTYSSCVATPLPTHFNSHFPELHSTNSGPNPDADAESQKHLGINPNLDRTLNSHHSASSGISERSDRSGQHRTLGGTEPPPLNDNNKGQKKVEITDKEWEIRTGECAYVFFWYVSLMQW